IYKSETCDGCKKLFDPVDDIVVCPVCGTPQHRACWLEHNACVNDALHAEGFVWRTAGMQEDAGGFDPKKDIGKVCAHCGTNNPADAENCADCKKSLAGDQPVTTAQPVAAPPPFSTLKDDKLPPFLSGIPEGDVVGGVRAWDIGLYTQLGAKRYIEKFRKLEVPGAKISWSWPAFFFTPYWFFYRKLYWLGGIFLGLTLALSLFFAGPTAEIQKILLAMPLSNITPADMAGLQAQLAGYSGMLWGMVGLNLVTRVAAALTAVPSYKKKVMTNITSMRRFAKDENVFRLLAIRRGGTSGLALMGSVLLYDLVWMLINQTVSRL
ncbi:MAG TPA: RING finger protein, partial [Clostridia bacterium]|nr:RING finger protein [Clostridia bacterium]